MNSRSKTIVRSLFVVLISVSVLTVGSAYASVFSGTAGEAASAAEERYAANSTESVVEPAAGITVVATDSNSWLGRESDDPRSKAELVAFNPDGSVRYYNDDHTRYWDIDPVPGTEATVEYLYADHLNASRCPDFLSSSYYNESEYAQTVNRSTWEEYAQVQEPVGACTRNGIERVNLTTGETTSVYTQVTPGKAETRWHDADRINATTYAVSDIFLDQAFVLDARSENITWSWNAKVEFPRSSGGTYPDDWTHTNDVEVLPDGRLMLDLRNQDRVVFLDPGKPPADALQEEWTLGEENNYSILYEQHNPDYVPPAEGGPAAVVADSENNRAVEYQRVNGSWKQTWIWTDARMQWPRDADRLPNGNTLITDTNGDRVLEVDRQGRIVWSANVGMPYEAERLGTGDESTNGPSARSVDLLSRGASPDAPPNGSSVQAGGPIEQAWLDARSSLSGPVFSGIMYVLPLWMGVTELGAVLLLGLSVLGWLLLEAWWARYPQRLAARVQSG